MYTPVPPNTYTSCSRCGLRIFPTITDPAAQVCECQEIMRCDFNTILKGLFKG